MDLVAVMLVVHKLRVVQMQEFLDKGILVVLEEVNLLMQTLLQAVVEEQVVKEVIVLVLLVVLVVSEFKFSYLQNQEELN